MAKAHRIYGPSTFPHFSGFCVQKSLFAEKSFFSEKVHFLRKSALFRKMGLRGPQKSAYVFRFWSPGARRAHFGEKVHFFALFAPLGSPSLTDAIFGPGRPPLRRTTAGWGGVHPPPWTLPQPPHAQTHTSVGVRPELIPFGAALRLLIPLTPTCRSTLFCLQP